MNLSRCEKGHFFDKEKYASCPHCQGSGQTDESLTTVFTEDMTSAAPPMSTPTPQPTPQPIQQPTPQPPVMDATLPVADMPVGQKTVPVGVGGEAFNTGSPTVPLNPPNNSNIFGKMETMPADDDDDHTVAFYDDVFSSVAATSAPASVPVGQNHISSPCVGWLISMGGAHVGQDFRLKVGKNFVGRDPQMDIALVGDKSVSRNRHAIIVYEPKQHLYLVQPGDSSGLVYKNNDVVLSAVQLEAYDMITVGDVNLLFMPLCGSRFNWSDLLDEIAKNQED